MGNVGVGLASQILSDLRSEKEYYLRKLGNPMGFEHGNHTPELWSGEVFVPALPDRKQKVGKNWIVQRVFPGARTPARIISSDYPGHNLLITSLSAPFAKLLIRRKGARKLDVPLPVAHITAVGIEDSIPSNFEIEWENIEALSGYANNPDEVLKEWHGKFSFRIADESLGTHGLRRPQIGALHAISAHFMVGEKFEPATVVLPTGTGKTETMLAAQVYGRFQRTMLLVPSDALRSQIADKFLTLGVLPAACIVPKELPRPIVAIITTGIKSAEEAEEILAKANVIITLPDTLSVSHPQAVELLASGCSDLVVDEAHHVTAKTWEVVRDKFRNKRILQFTATPFRRDHKRIDGKIIFNYRLGDAQKAGYYKPIDLKIIEEYGEQELRDTRIAIEALKILRRDRDELGLNHLLMARTKTKERAEAVVKIYNRLAADMRPIVVYSGPGQSVNNRISLARLKDGGPQGSRIVVCVDMLGEGYDLPNLKVAALHDAHKSLAITLQFIGRFTRTGIPQEIGDASVVANIADKETESKLSDLYSEGADWDLIIRRLSENRIDEEIKLQDIVYGLKESGDLNDQLSLWNLRPPLSAQLFRARCVKWDPLRFADVLPPRSEYWHAYDEKSSTFIAVVRRAADVAWGDYQNIYNTVYDLVIAHWNVQTGLLALYASDYNALRSEKMALAMTAEDTELVCGSPIFNILNNVQLPLVKSLGSSRIGAISFTSYFGPNVTEGLAFIEKAEAELNNLACLGYEDGERVVWGGTQRRGKVWQQKTGTISQWIAWASVTWGKVSSGEIATQNVIRDFLRPEKLKLPYHSMPIAAQWGEQAQLRFKDRQFLLFDDVEVPLFEVEVAILPQDSIGRVLIVFSTDNRSSEYELLIDSSLPGGYTHRHISGDRLRFRVRAENAQNIEEYLQKDPLIIRYADGTYSYNCYHIPLRLNAGEISKDQLEAWNWGSIPLNAESMHKHGDKNTIQYATFEKLKDDYRLIFNDDGSGEAADLVCLKDVDENTVELCLVHCKGAYKGLVSQDIRNFYTVCGQAQKSIAVRHAGLGVLYNDLKRRQESWAAQGASRFLKGGMKELAYFKEKARRSKLSFEVILVQPGVSVKKITPDILKLLGTTELYLKKTTEANVRVVVSE